VLILLQVLTLQVLIPQVLILQVLTLQVLTPQVLGLPPSIPSTFCRSLFIDPISHRVTADIAPGIVHTTEGSWREAAGRGDWRSYWRRELLLGETQMRSTCACLLCQASAAGGSRTSEDPRKIQQQRGFRDPTGGE
jgi:hypothetical protein